MRDPPCPAWSGTVPYDDKVYIVAGHKGRPTAVVAVGREGRQWRLQGQHGRGALAQKKPSVLGMIEQTGQLLLAYYCRFNVALTIFSVLGLWLALAIDVALTVTWYARVSQSNPTPTFRLTSPKEALC